MDANEAANLIAKIVATKLKDGNGLPGISKKPLSLSVQASNLRDVYGTMQRKCPFQPGDLVEQDPTLSAYRSPAPGEIAIVTAVGDNIDANRRSRSDATYERNDMVILCLIKHTHDEDEELHAHWVQFAVESWRFKMVDVSRLQE